jgi:hypothetical protein
MNRDRSLTSPWEYMDFELEIPKGGYREHPATVRSLTGEMQMLPRELMYDLRRNEYLCFSSGIPLVRYLKLSQLVEQLPVMLTLSIPRMAVSPPRFGAT